MPQSQFISFTTNDTVSVATTDPTIDTATVATNAGGTIVIGGGAGVAGGALVTGTVGYLAATAAS